MSPRVKDALSRAFVASNELGHSYVGPEHFLIGLAEGRRKGLAATCCACYGLMPQALRQQVSKVVGKGAEDGRAGDADQHARTRQVPRDLTKMARRRQARPGDRPRRRRSNHHRGAGPAQEEQPGADRRAGCGQDRHRRRAGAAHGGGEVPRPCATSARVELNINAMVAGAKYRGEFEERVQRGPEGGDRAPERADFVHRRGAHHRRCRRGGGEGGLDVVNVSNRDDGAR